MNAKILSGDVTGLAEDDVSNDIRHKVSVECESTASELLQALAHLQQQGGDQYDPSRFCFIESMVKRAAVQRESVRRQVLSCAQRALEDYRTTMVNADIEARAVLDDFAAMVSFQDSSGSQVFPQVAQLVSQGEAYYQQKRFNQVLSLKRYSQRLQLPQPAISALAQLQYVLGQASSDGTLDTETNIGQTSAIGSDTIAQLQQESQKQQQHFLNEHSPLLTVKTRSEVSVYHHQGMATLKASHTHQKFQYKKRVDNFIDIAFNETPENPGPLNPEILSIRLLKAINDRSPEYISRYVSYFETLHWLDKVND